LSNRDEQRADSAKVIRLIIDDNRWEMDCVNEVYQRHVLRDVANFIGPSSAIVATPAGMVTTRIGWADETRTPVEAGLQAVNNVLSELDFGPNPSELLLGVDGCVPDQATPLQTVVHLGGILRRATTGNTTVKLYPMGGENRFLLGWEATLAAAYVPEALAQARRVVTANGWFVVLVCNDACLFSNRSRKNLENPISIRIREHFLEAATALPRPAFILLATHHQAGPRSGSAFKNAASNLAEETGATVLTTMFTRQGELEMMADYFPIRGGRADEVVTLLVEDTL
jgi:hypothetical protein